MKVLFLTPQLPYPPKSGGVLKSFELVKFLSSRYALSVGCLIKGEDHLFEGEFKRSISLKKYFSLRVDIPRTALNYLRSLIKRVPISIYRNYSSSFEKLVLEEIDEYSVIFVDHFLMYQYIPKSYLGKIILHEHNAEYILWKSFSKNESNYLKKLISFLESKRVAHYERTIGRRVDQILAAPNDIENLEMLGIPLQKFVKTLHLGDPHLLSLPDLTFLDTNEELLFIGTLSWEPNRDGLLWFLQEIWPLVNKANSKVIFRIIGRGHDEKIATLAKELQNCVFMGEVDDLLPYYKTARVFISPLRFGSGIKVKNINAMYVGLPLVTTPVGIEGLDLKSGEEVLYSTDGNELVSYILRLLADSSYWKQLSTASKAYARRELSWEPVLENVRRVIEC